MLTRAVRSFRHPGIAFALASLVIAWAAIYAVVYVDPYIALFMAPFFALGCARGKRPIALLALSLGPALFLLSVSQLKLTLTGMPLVAHDHYFLRRNVLMLAYNDWRVAIALIVIVGAALLYIKQLLSGRGSFSRFEKIALTAIGLGAVASIAGVPRLDHELLDWDTQAGAPSLATLVRSALVPNPQLHVLAPADLEPATPRKGLGAPEGPLPDIFLVLQESTFPPAMLRPKHAPKTLFAKAHAGVLRVPTFAGGTWKTEFSITTQMRPQEFGNDGLYVFHQLEGRIKRSIFTELKALGYRTMVFYPVPGFFLNARAFYASIGVDEFHDPQSLGISAGWNWQLSDAEIYGAMLRKIDAAGSPVVALMLTINQHGPHEVQDPFADYVARFAESDKAYGDLLDTLSHRGRRAGVVAFGDHQPEFTARFIENHDDRFITAYDIRCINFECAKTATSDRGTKPLDAVMLTPLALEKFGFALDSFSVLQRKLFAACDDDVSRCADAENRAFNTAFSRYFD